MSQLLNSLKKVSQERREEMNAASAVTETQRLLANDSAQDYEILKEMGMHKSIEFATELHSKKIELENLEKKYGQVFSLNEIKAVACKYALKFRRSDNYKGGIDVVMFQKMKEFFKDAKIEINKAKLGYNFYILAPQNAFELVERPTPTPPDPILFYKLDENNYRLIHKWGSDLTIFRRITGWKYKSHFNYWLTYFVKYTSFVLPLWFIKFFNSFETAWFAVPVILSVIAIIASFAASANGEKENEKFRKWEEIWQDEFKVNP